MYIQDPRTGRMKGSKVRRATPKPVVERPKQKGKLSAELGFITGELALARTRLSDSFKSACAFTGRRGVLATFCATAAVFCGAQLAHAEQPVIQAGAPAVRDEFGVRVCAKEESMWKADIAWGYIPSGSPICFEQGAVEMMREQYPDWFATHFEPLPVPLGRPAPKYKGSAVVSAHRDGKGVVRFGCKLGSRPFKSVAPGSTGFPHNEVRCHTAQREGWKPVRQLRR